MSDLQVSIVLPARNEAAIIEASVRRVVDVLSEMDRSWEVLVVDSASDDDTGARVEALGHPRVRVVREDRPGKGAAIVAGLRAARGRYVGFMDSDLEIDPAELPRFVQALDDGAEAAIATKVDAPGDRPWRRRLSTVVYNGVVRAFLGTPHRDHQGGMKLFRGEALDRARATDCPGWFWDTEVLAGLAHDGRAVAEVPVTAGTRRANGLSIVPVTLELLRGVSRLLLPRLGRGLVARWGLLAPVGCALALLGVLHPGLLLSDTTPTGYDLAGHVYPFSQGVTQLLEHGRVHGWSQGWFAGFPLFYFYFPLPLLLNAVLTPVLGFAPAFKVMSVVGLLGFPFAVYALLTTLELGRAGRMVGTVAATGFLFTRYVDLGANIPSTLGGEFAFSISFTLSIGYLAALLRARRTPGPGSTILASLLLAGTALSHTITTVAVVLVAAPLLLDRSARRTVLASWVLGFLVTGFWSVPFIARSGFLWSPFPDPPPLGPRLLPTLVALALPAALAGLWTLRRRRGVWLVGWMGLVAYGAAAVPQEAFFSLRFLTYGYLVVFVLAGAAAGALADTAVRPSPEPTATRALGAGAGAVLVLLLALVGTLQYGTFRARADRTFRGFEADAAWPVIHGLVDALSTTPPGRVFWEDDATLFARLGSRNLLTLLPYWSPTHDALGGLWVESSPTAGVARRLSREIAEAGQARDGGVAWRQVLDSLGAVGVRYFVAVRPASVALLRTLPDMRLLASSGPLTLFEIPSLPVVRTTEGEAARDVRVADREISFRAPGSGPGLQLRFSYFPNWVAQGGSVGSDGTFMRVQTTSNEVRLRFGWTWAEWAGWAATLASVVWVVALLGAALKPPRP